MPTDNVEEIKGKLDIVELVQEYVQIKPAGSNNFKGLCPFHHEKTPSFTVSRDKQIWHCFGCGEGGDAFSFVMKMEGTEFPDALRLLAEKTGVKLQYQDPAVTSQRQRLQEVCVAAADFYYQVLAKHPKAQAVREYLQHRLISDETAETWQIGFAPDAWDTLGQYLQQRKFSPEDIFLAGLTLKKERGVGYVDRFRNRLMFPIADGHGNVVGFGGRWLGAESEKAAKYINTPQTTIYDKSRILYGLDKAKMEIKREKQAVVVEGYMDCITSHQAGVANVVASSGTALTPDHVRLLKRLTNTVAFAFDQDLAGDTASRRGIEVAWQEELNTKVIRIHGAKDPDELIKQDVKLWRQAIAGAQAVMDYYFESVLSTSNLSKVEDKKSAAKTLLPVIAKLVDPIEQTHYIQKLARLLGVEERVLRDKLARLSVRGARRVAPAGAAAPRDRFTSLGEEIVGLFLSYPELLATISQDLQPELLPTDRLQKLYKQVIIYYTEKHVFDYRRFIAEGCAGDPAMATYANLLAMRASDSFPDVPVAELRDEVTRGTHELRRHAVQLQLREVEVALRSAELQRDRPAADELSRRFTELTDELKTLG
ncbi:MAG: DNA primase [Patescibacteria group bacterium]